jgi:glycosyltransferase involved in cell wall biosynthesis
MLKVAVSCGTRGVAGGTETYLAAIVPALSGVGVCVGLWQEGSYRQTIGVADGNGKIPVWCAGELGEETSLNCLREWGPNVIYHHGLRSARAEERLLEIAPVVAYLHDYWGTCISGSKTQCWPHFIPCRRRFGTACLLQYFPRRCGGWSPLTLVRQYGRQRRRQALLDEFAGVLVASDHMRDEYLRQGVAPERLHVVPLFPPGLQPDLEPPVPRPLNGHVLMVGRLTKLKGGELLIESMSQARAALRRPLTLTVAGDGPRRAAMEALARREGISARFRGWVSAAQWTQLMRDADVLAVPSVWPEPFGLVGIEAGCVGLPAVGFAVGGIPEWLVSGVSGELAPGDRPRPQDLADAMVRAVADEAHWHRLRRGAWEVARSFNIETHLQRLIPLLAQAAQGRLCVNGIRNP